jgi:hypothetical protein
METQPKFYIELPADEHGNTAMLPAVYEGTIVQGAGYRKIIFHAPEYALRHKDMRLDSYGGYAEVEGPARMLTHEEWSKLTQGKKPI